MTIGAATLGKGGVKKNAVKQFLEQTLAKKSLTQTMKDGVQPGGAAIDRMKKTGQNFTMPDMGLESSMLNPTKAGGGSLPAEGNRYQSNMGQTMYN